MLRWSSGKDKHHGQLQWQNSESLTMKWQKYLSPEGNNHNMATLTTYYLQHRCCYGVALCIMWYNTVTQNYIVQATQCMNEEWTYKLHVILFFPYIQRQACFKLPGKWIKLISAIIVKGSIHIEGSLINALSSCHSNHLHHVHKLVSKVQ